MQSGRVSLSASSLTPIFTSSFLTSLFREECGQRIGGCWLGSWQASLICTVNLMKLVLQNCALGSSPGFCHFPFGQDKWLHLIKPLCFICLISISKGNLKDYLSVDLSQCLMQATAFFLLIINSFQLYRIMWRNMEE